LKVDKESTLKRLLLEQLRASGVGTSAIAIFNKQIIMFLEYSNTRLIVASSNLSSSQEYNSTKTKRRQRFDFDDAILMCCFIVTAALTLFSDFDHYTILGQTSLISMGPAAFVGTLTHYNARKVNMQVTPFLAMVTLVGAFAGGKIGLQVDEVSLRHGFSAMMLTLGVRTILKA
jgi:hypothetical protein